MPRYGLRTLAGALVLASALLLLACEPDSDAPSIGGLLKTTLTPTPTTTALLTAVTGTPAATAASGTPTPAPAEKPRVLWMLRDHGGSNVAVVRFAANEEVTAVLSLVGSPGQPPTGVDPQTDADFAAEHTLSIPLGVAPGTPPPAFLNLEVTDRQGTKATATLEYGDTIVGTQFWAQAEGKPAFAFTAPFKGAATWTNLVGQGAQPPPGVVQLFGKVAGCTTAEQCPAGLLATFTEDTPAPAAGGESHSIPVELPPTPDQDFQLLYTSIADGDQAVSYFYQRDIARSAAVAGHE
jgi:hypothetical protein